MIVGIGGSYTYKYFTSPQQQFFSPTDRSSYDHLPPIPPQCEDLGETLEDAVYNHELGKITIIEINQFSRRFQSCLLAAGFTDGQVYRTYDEIVEVVLNID
jgi:hypothetical protein